MDSVKVAIRIRPLIARERGSEEIWVADTQQIQLKDGRKDPYIFDRVFGSDETTSDVYEEIVEPIVESAMTGFNGTVFAYGQTSSGKTYTMMGGGSNPGIIPLSVRDTFAHIQKTPEREFLLRVCYMEIYNEVVRDLLVSDASGLQIREDEFRNAVVQGLTEKVVGSEDEVLDLIRQGDKRRHIGCTNMNERSSRSHTIFRMILESRERVDPNTTKDSVEFDSAVKISQLNLVDLAGSERAHQAGTEGQRFKEGCHINKSLLTLGVVINQICKASETGQSAQFISYRDSKLTRILQPSLGGNSLTAIICAVTPVSYDDTDSTLRFASNAKKIKNKPHVNEVLSDEALLYRQKREINQLKKRIRELELNAGKKKNEELETMLVEKEKLQKEQEDRIATLKKIIIVSTQPVDVKRQRNIRRETWCPGKLKAVSSGAVTAPRDMNITNQSAFFQLDQNLLGVDFEPMMKRSKYSDTDVLPRRSLDAADLKSEAEAASEHFVTLEDELILKRWQQERLEEDLRTAQKEKDDILKENEATKLKMMRMQQELDCQTENVTEVFDEKLKVEAENEELKKTIQNQNSQISDFIRKEKQWLDSNPDVLSLKELQNDLQEQLRDVCSQNCRLQLKSDDDRNSIRQLQSKLNNVTVELKDKKESLEEYKSQVSSLQSQLEATFTSSKSQSSLSAPDGDMTIKKQLEAELKEKKAEVDRLTQELEDKIDQSDMDEILDQLEKQTSENCKLRLLIQDLKNDSEKAMEKPDLKSHVEDAMNESVRIGEKTFRECLESCEELAERNTRLSEQMESLQKENEQLKLRTESKFGQKTMENAVAEYDEVVQEKDNLLQQVAELKREVKLLHSKNRDQKKCIQSLTENKEFLDMEKEVFSQQEKEQEEKILSLKGQISKLNAQIATLQSGANGSVDDLTTKQNTDVRQLQEENNILQKSSMDAQAMLQDANKELAMANMTVDTQHKEIETLTEELKHVRSDLDSFNSMSEVTKQKYEKKVEELSQQLQLAYDQLGHGDGKPDDLQNHAAEIQEYKVCLDEKNAEIDSLKKQLADSLVEFEQIQASIQGYKSAEESLKRDSESGHHGEDAGNVLKTFGMTMEALKKKISMVDDLQKERDDLILDQQDKSSKIQALEDSLKNTEMDVIGDDLKNTVSELEAALKDKDSKLEVMENLQQENMTTLENLKADLQEKENKCLYDVQKVEELQRIHDEKEEIISNLQSKLEESTSKQSELENRLNEVSDSMTDDEKKLRDLLANSRKDLAEMTEKYEKLNTITQHAQGALLAETNRDLGHQRQLQMSEIQRRESALEMASERESANKQINQLLSKVGELQTLLSRADVQKDIAVRERNKATEECEFLRQQVKSLESIHRDEGSIVPRGQVMDPDKLAERIKRLSANLEYSNQIQGKLKAANATLTDENKKLERDGIKVMELQAEVGKLNGILEQESKARLDGNTRYNSLQQEANSMRERIVELGKQLKEAKDNHINEVDKFATQLESCENEKRILQVDIENSQNRIKEMDSKISDLVNQETENSVKTKHLQESLEELKLKLEESKAVKTEDVRCIESLQDRLEHSSRALDEERKKIAETNENYSILMSDMDKVSGELEAKTMMVNDLKEKNDLLVQSLEKMKEKLSVKEEEIKNARNETSEHEEMEKNLQNVCDNLNNVEIERDSLLKKISDMENELVQKDEVVLQLNNDNHVTLSKLSEEEKKFIEMEQILGETNSTLSSKIQEIEILSNENKMLENKISILKSESDNKEDGDDLEKETSYNVVKDQLDGVNREKEILLKKVHELEVAAALTEEGFHAQDDEGESEDLVEKVSNLESDLESVIMDKETALRLLEEKDQEHTDAVNEFDKLIHEKEEKIKALQESGDNLESLSKELTSLKCKLVEKQKENDQIKNQLETLKLQNQEKRHGDVSVSEYGMEFSHSFDQEMIDQLYEQVAELKLQVDEKNDIIQGMKLTSPTDTRDEEIISLKEESEKLKQQLQLLTNDIKDKDERILSELQKASEDTKALNGDTELKMKNKELESRISELEQALDSKGNHSETDPKINELKGVGSSEELDNLRRKTIEQAGKITKLRSLLETEGEEMASLKKQLLDLGHSLESENGRIIALKQAKKDAEDLILKLKSENDELSNFKQLHVNVEHQEKDEWIKKYSELECSLKESNEKYAESVKQLQNSNEAAEEAVSQKVEKENEINRLENELESYRNQLANLQDCESAMISAKETILTLEQQLGEVDNMKNDEITEMKCKISDFEDQTRKYEDKVKNYKELEDLNQQLIKENDVMEKKVAESVEGRDVKIFELENLLKMKETEFDSDRHSFEAEISRLKQETASLNGDLESVYAMIREKAALMEESASSREALEKNVEDLKLENESLKSKFENATAQQNSTSADLNENILNAEARIEELQQSNLKLEKDRDSLVTENEKYKKEVVTLESEIQEAVDTIQDLQREVDNMKCEKENLIEEQKKGTNTKRRGRDLECLVASLQDEMKMMQETKDSLEKRIIEVEKESASKEKILQKDWEENKKDLEDQLEQSENVRKETQEKLETTESKLKSTEELYSKELEEEQEGQRFLASEIADLKVKLATAEEENALNQCKEDKLKKSVDEIKGLLYKKELEVQTLQSEIISWERRHQEDKLEMENAIKLAKEDVTAMVEKNDAQVKELTTKLTLAEQINQKLQNKAKSALEVEASNVESSNQQKAELEAQVSELTLNIKTLNEEHEKQISSIEESAKADKKQLLAKIDDYEQGLFEQDRDLEEEKAKTNQLEKKVSELENDLKVAQSSSSAEPASKISHLRQKFEAKCAKERKKCQDLEMQLCVEKQRSSQLTTKLQEFERDVGTDVDVAREAFAKRQTEEAYEDKLKKIEVDFQNKMKEREERMEWTKKLLGDRVNQLEDSCIESEMELEQVKLKNAELSKKLEEQQKLGSNEDVKRKLEKEVTCKESEVTRLQIQLKSCKEPLERENCQLKEELKLCEDRISNLKQQVKLAAGSGSAERQQSMGRVTRSSSLRKQSTSQAGVVRESKMYILEMEISDNQHRIKYLEKELVKYKDIEVKRRSENMELLEENKKYRSLIKKAREKRLGSSDVLTENTAILNQDPSPASRALPRAHTVHDDKCKNQ